MPPVDKAKAAGVSARSFLDLQAELAKKQEEFAKNKASGKADAIVGGVKRNDKKLSRWAKANPGVQARAARDAVELEAVSKTTVDDALAVLARKSEKYKKLAKGLDGGFNKKQASELLVDFEQKGIDRYESDSDDVDESLTVPVAPQDDDDPIVEYEDEFGRVRTARRSEIPRHLLPDREKEQEEEEDEYVVHALTCLYMLTFPHNPVNHFPVYEPSRERVEQIRAEYAEENNPLNVHYDATREVRAKGAGFYQFSGDEETRRQQMEELRKAREETERTRAEVGAEDVRPGEVEGMHPGGEASAVPAKSRAMEKRKREIEERRKLLEAKRRKLGGKDGAAASKATPVSGDEQKTPAAPPSAAAADPFAALEALSGNKPEKNRATEPPVNAADAFLAQLEQDIMKSKG
ncbi:hypothetical protein C8Q77DRAFT_1216266 [Trametes polyzona]|nr:hypothetical protein C8Q77DRAFT_1216266 [Trametes polyzona]